MPEPLRRASGARQFLCVDAREGLRILHVRAASTSQNLETLLQPASPSVVRRSSPADRPIPQMPRLPFRNGTGASAVPSTDSKGERRGGSAAAEVVCRSASGFANRSGARQAHCSRGDEIKKPSSPQRSPPAGHRPRVPASARPVGRPAPRRRPGLSPPAGLLVPRRSSARCARSCGRTCQACGCAPRALPRSSRRFLNFAVGGPLKLVRRGCRLQSLQFVARQSFRKPRPASLRCGLGLTNPRSEIPQHLVDRSKRLHPSSFQQYTPRADALEQGGVVRSQH